MDISKQEHTNPDGFFLKEMHPLKINVNVGLSENQRNAIYAILKVLYADTFVLMVKTLDYHWHMRGHLGNDERNATYGQYQELFQSLSDLARRITILGYAVPGSLFQVMNETTLVEKSSKVSAIALIADLINDNENIAKYIREELTIVYGAKDETTLNILRKRLECHEDNAWKLRSLIEK